jgi:hypothetical protein
MRIFVLTATYELRVSRKSTYVTTLSGVDQVLVSDPAMIKNEPKRDKNDELYDKESFLGCNFSWNFDILHRGKKITVNYWPEKPWFGSRIQLKV